MKHIVNIAFVNAVATALYVAAIGFFLSFAGHVKLGELNPWLIPIFMLLLFVLSAAITGTLVLGRPVLWYLDGRKQESLLLFGYTIGFLAAITLVLFILLMYIPAFFS